MRRFYKAIVQRPLRGLLYALFLGMSLMLRLAGPAVSRRVAMAIGGLAGRVLPHERRVAAVNLRRVFPNRSEAERLAIRQAVFRHFGECGAELLHVEHALAGVTLTGTDELKAAAAQSGAIVISGHIGNWELLGAAVARAGVPLTVIARRIFDPRFDRWMRDWRSAFGTETVVRDTPDTVKRMLGALADKRVLVLLIDQDTDVPSVWVPFFGAPAKTPSGPARLAVKGTPVFCASIRRTAPWRYEAQLRRLEGLPADIEAMTARFNQALEKEILCAPTEWVWFHDRWRSPVPTAG